MKIVIDSDTLLECVRRGFGMPVSESDRKLIGRYLDGRAAATQHIATLIGIELMAEGADPDVMNQFLELKDPNACTPKPK